MNVKSVKLMKRREINIYYAKYCLHAKHTTFLVVEERSIKDERAIQSFSSFGDIICSLPKGMHFKPKNKFENKIWKWFQTSEWNDGKKQ